MDTFRKTPKVKQSSKLNTQIVTTNQTQQNSVTLVVADGNTIQTPPTSPTSTTSSSALSPAKWKNFFFKQNSSTNVNGKHNVQISQPFDVNHITHVDFDPHSQELSGLPSNWTSTLKRSANKLVRRRRDSTSQRNVLKPSNKSTHHQSNFADGPSSRLPTPTIDSPSKKDKVKSNPSISTTRSPVPISKQYARNSTPTLQQANTTTTTTAASSINNATITSGTSTISSSISTPSSSFIDGSMSSSISVGNLSSLASPDYMLSPPTSPKQPYTVTSSTKSTSFNGTGSMSMVIGAPMQAKREIHITWNPVTGQFEGVPEYWSDLVQKITTEKQEKHKMDIRKRLLKEELSKCEREERHRRLVRDKRERARLNREERSMSVSNTKNKPGIESPILISSSVNNKSTTTTTTSNNLTTNNTTTTTTTTSSTLTSSLIKSTYQSTLIQVSGVEVFKSKRVELSLQSLCKNDVFVLDSGSKVYVWVGSTSSLQKQVRGLSIASKIKYQSKVILEPISIEILIDADRRDSTTLCNFFRILNNDLQDGQLFDATRESTETDAELTTIEESTTWLYRVSDNGKIVSIDERPLIPTALNSNTCFILDCETDIFVWNGRNAHPLQQRVAAIFANEFIQIFSDRPQWATLHNVHQDEEPWYFKERFLYWLEEESVIDTSRRYTLRAKDMPLPLPPVPLDSPTLIPEVLIDPQYPEPRRGVTLSIDLWQSEESTWTKVPQEHHGNFMVSRAYVCHHIYRLDDRVNSRVYFWQGSEAPIKWWIVFQFGLYKEIQSHIRQLAPTLPPPNTECLTQHKETSPFMNLFGNYIMVHRDTSQTVLLYHLTLSACTRFVRCTQFSSFNLSNLNSRQVFILYNQSLKSSFIWYGRSCSERLRADAVDVANSLHCYLQQQNDPTVFNLVVECEENKEPISFWKQFSGVDKRLEQFTLNSSSIDLTVFLRPNTSPLRTYPKSMDSLANCLNNTSSGNNNNNSSIANYVPRLYHIYYHSKARKYVVTRVKPFCQSDLVAEDAFVLDTRVKLHVWIGPQCSRKKRETAESFAKLYRDQSTLGHSTMTTVDIESFRFESYEFRSYFDAWNSEFQPQSLRNITAQALIGIGADYRLLNSIASNQIQTDETVLDSEDSDEDTASLSLTPLALTPHSSPPLMARTMEKWEMELESEVERLKKKGYSPLLPRLRGQLNGMSTMRLNDSQNKRNRQDSFGSTTSGVSLYSSSPEKGHLLHHQDIMLDDKLGDPKRTRSDSNELIAQATKARLRKRGSSLLNRSPSSQLQQRRNSITLNKPIIQGGTIDAKSLQELKEWTVEVEVDVEVSKLEEELSKLDKISEESKLKRAKSPPPSSSNLATSATEPISIPFSGNNNIEDKLASSPPISSTKPPFSPRKPQSPLVASLPPPPPVPSSTDTTPSVCSPPISLSTPRLPTVKETEGNQEKEEVSVITKSESTTSPVIKPPPIALSPKSSDDVSSNTPTVVSPKPRPVVPPRNFLNSSTTSLVPTNTTTSSAPSVQPPKPTIFTGTGSISKGTPKPLPYIPPRPVVSPPVSPRENSTPVSPRFQGASASTASITASLPSPPTKIPAIPSNQQQEIPKTRFKFIVKPLMKSKPSPATSQRSTTNNNNVSVNPGTSTNTTNTYVQSNTQSTPFNTISKSSTQIPFGNSNQTTSSSGISAKTTTTTTTQVPNRSQSPPIQPQQQQQQQIQHQQISPDKKIVSDTPLSVSTSSLSSTLNQQQQQQPKPLPYPPNFGSVRDRIHQHESFSKHTGQQIAVHASLPIQRQPPSPKYTSLQSIFLPPNKPLPPPPPPRNFSPSLSNSSNSVAPLRK